MQKKLKEIMTRDVKVVQPDTLLKEAALLMRQLNIGLLPVVQGQTLIGTLTDRDITVRATAEGRDPGKTKVREVMTQDVVCGFEEQDVQEAARLMSERHIRRLPVLNQDKKLAGIVSLGDVAVNGDAELAATTLRAVSTTTKARR